MIVTVQFIGDQFVAYDPDGNQIKDRAILEQVAFEPFPGFKNTFLLEIDDSIFFNIPEELNVNISITPK